MGIGKNSDLKVYNPQIQTGLIETLAQVSAAFNEASRGAIRLVANRIPGDYQYGAFWQSLANLISRRDLTSVSAATDIAATQAEMISVKLNRKIGPLAQTLDSFRKIGSAANENSLDFMIGTQIAKAMQVDMCDVALGALRGALTNYSSGAVMYTVPSSGTLDSAGLVSGLAKRGDRATDVVCWVMHSKPYYDLVKAQLAANIDGVSNFNLATATPVTLNRPVLVTDSASLGPIVTGTGTAAVTDYYTLGLTEGACVVEDSEEEYIVRDIVTGLENLVVRLQGEYAMNLGLRGFQWDTTNGGKNPTSAATATGSNWDAVAASLKDLGGIVVKSR